MINYSQLAKKGFPHDCIKDIGNSTKDINIPIPHQSGNKETC